MSVNFEVTTLSNVQHHLDFICQIINLIKTIHLSRDEPEKLYTRDSDDFKQGWIYVSNSCTINIHQLEDTNMNLNIYSPVFQVTLLLSIKFIDSSDILTVIFFK